MNVARPTVAVFVAIMLLGIVGCQPNSPIVPDTFYPTAQHTRRPTPSYHDLVQRYNANLAGLDRLWARTDVDVRWRDEDGDSRSESGGGKLIIVPPRNVALTVGKLGRTGLWAGSNDAMYWMFDLQNDEAYFGRHANVGRPCTQPLPLPVRPSSVPSLLGLTRIDPDAPPSGPGPDVERVKGYWLIEPPGMHVRLLLDPATARPVRIDLTDDFGQSVLVSQLSGYAPVEVVSKTRGRPPMLASHAELFPLGREARLTLDLSAMTDGRRENRINPKVFDLNVLMQLHRPEHTTDLDAGCGGASRVN